jgi:hypothetical protein
MTAFRPSRSRIALSQQCHAFLDHWRKVRGSAMAPTLSQWLANESVELAPRSMIGEFVHDDVRIRIVGSEFITRWGKDFTGQLIYQARSEAYRSAAMDNHWKMMTCPCGYAFDMEFRTKRKRSFRTLGVMLPLASTPSEPWRMVIFSHELAALMPRETLAAPTYVLKGNWIDIGAGVPTFDPVGPSDI